MSTCTLKICGTLNNVLVGGIYGWWWVFWVGLKLRRKNGRQMQNCNLWSCSQAFPVLLIQKAAFHILSNTSPDPTLFLPVKYNFYFPSEKVVAEHNPLTLFLCPCCLSNLEYLLCSNCEISILEKCLVWKQLWRSWSSSTRVIRL